MTYTEFSQLAKSTFVDVALGEYGKNGRPANLSRVAIITGLSRREVSRVRDQLTQDATDSGDGEELRFWSPASRVLSGWHQDPDFADENGEPAALPLVGDGMSVRALLDRYGGDIPPGAMLSELERVGAIAIEDGTAKLLSRNYMNANQSTEVLAMVGSYIHDFASTLEFNLQVGAGERPWFQRVAQNAYLKPSTLKLLKKIVAQDGQALLENLDAWLSAHESDDDNDDRVQAGVGVYYFQDRHRTRSYKMTWSESLRARAGDGDIHEGNVSAPRSISLGDT